MTQERVPNGTLFFSQMLMESLRLTLEPLAELHLTDYFRLVGNPEVMKYIRAPAVDLADALTRLRRYTDYASRAPGLGAFAIFTKENRRFVGVGVLIHLELKIESGKIEVGYQFLPEEWGQGFAQEVTGCLLKYGFEELELTEIYGTTHPDHLVSQTVLQKCGLTPIGRLEVHGGSTAFVIKRS
jgi:ribosomal-protein-alanine N-acetyltransferase